MLYHFGRFTLLAGDCRLLQDGQDVAVGPRALEVLIALVERAGRLEGATGSVCWADTLTVAQAGLRGLRREARHAAFNRTAAPDRPRSRRPRRAAASSTR